MLDQGIFPYPCLIYLLILMYQLFHLCDFSYFRYVPSLMETLYFYCRVYSLFLTARRRVGRRAELARFDTSTGLTS